MQKINNPHAHDSSKRYNCFGCSHNNPIGLHLEFYLDEDEVVAFYEPTAAYEGFPNVLHGGIQSLLMDEVAAWAVYVLCKTAGVTVNLNISYKNPAYVDGGKLTVRAKVKAQSSRMAILATSIENAEGKICSEGEVKYFIYPEKVAREKLDYPGVEALLR